jgi:hypothetical protein
LIAAAPCRVGRAGVGERRRTDRDDGIEDWIELLDPVQVELRQLHGFQPMCVHQLLELWDRGRIDVDAGGARVRRFGPVALRRRDGAGHPEHECEKGRGNERSVKMTGHRAVPPWSRRPVKREVRGLVSF